MTHTGALFPPLLTEELAGYNETPSQGSRSIHPSINSFLNLDFNSAQLAHTGLQTRLGMLPACPSTHISTCSSNFRLKILPVQFGLLIHPSIHPSLCLLLPPVLDLALDSSLSTAARLAWISRQSALDTAQVTRSVQRATRKSESNQSQARPSQPKLSQANPSQAKPGQARPSQAKPGQARPSQPKLRQANPSQPKPTQAEPSQPKPTQANPS